MQPRDSAWQRCSNQLRSAHAKGQLRGYTDPDGYYRIPSSFVAAAVEAGGDTGYFHDRAYAPHSCLSYLSNS